MEHEQLYDAIATHKKTGEVMVIAERKRQNVAVAAKWLHQDKWPDYEFEVVPTSKESWR